MEPIAQIVTVIVVGTLVGVEFGVAAFTNPILEQLPDAAYRQARATGSRILGTVMPFWYAAAAALLVADAVLAPSFLSVAAVALMGVVMVLTLTTLVPINHRVAAWAGAGPDEVPTNRALAQRWDRLHWLRVTVLLAAFVLVALPR